MTPGYAVDTHAHVIDPDRFPLDPAGRGYRPGPSETGTADEHRAALTSHGITHGVLVQPSCYAYDNAALLDAISASEGRIKGIAVVEPAATREDLKALAQHGVVGFRLNLGSFDPQFFEHLSARRLLRDAAETGFIVQTYALGDAWTRIAPILRSAEARILVDHFGQPDTARGLDQPGFQAAIGLARDGRSVVKLSSIFRVSRQPFPHLDVDPFVRTALEAFGLDRCVWGSDWPFLGSNQGVSYERMLACLERFLPRAEDRRRVLWQAPARLFGFVEPAPGIPIHG